MVRQKPQVLSWDHFPWWLVASGASFDSRRFEATRTTEVAARLRDDACSKANSQNSLILGYRALKNIKK